MIEKNKGGRPKTIINFDTVEQLASIMCTKEEIASVLKINIKTLTSKPEFLPAYKRGQEHGKSSLRKAQFDSAIKKGNVSMQIWLGKQYLGQRDNLAIGTEEELNKVDLLLKGLENASKR